MTTPPDPAAFFRDMLGEWEKMTNRFGGEALKSADLARNMGAASTATMAGQQAFNQAMERAFAAANLPTKSDLTDLAARVAGVEATLARIEAKLGAGVAPAPDQPRPPRPTRTRKPTKSKS